MSLNMLKIIHSAYTYGHRNVNAEQKRSVILARDEFSKLNMFYPVAKLVACIKVRSQIKELLIYHEVFKTTLG